MEIQTSLQHLPISHRLGILLVLLGKFGRAMINQAIQVVFMDDWTNDSLCSEDSKRILQGKNVICWLFTWV